MSDETRTPYPDCASKDRPHGPHRLAGPGGNKPGAWCDGLSEPLCTCGHPQNLHHSTAQSGTEIWTQCDGEGVFSPLCGCRAFVLSPPPARSRDEAEKAIVAVLTPAERAQMNCDCPYRDIRCDQDRSCHFDTCFVPVVESILAARLADLMADAPTLGAGNA